VPQCFSSLQFPSFDLFSLETDEQFPGNEHFGNDFDSAAGQTIRGCKHGSAGSS